MSTELRRSSGILLPVSALPSPYGIGTLGRAARDFADFLIDAGQRCWQLLPLGHTGYADSPYSPFSSYAGNPYYVDLEALAEEGLLGEEELRSPRWGDDPRQVDYGALYENRWPLLQRAAARAWESRPGEIAAFAGENRDWLEDYALFMALKRRYGMAPWTAWPAPLRDREGQALAAARESCREDIRLFTFVQYAFFRQWDALRGYVREKGLTLIGDVPIYVAMDSSDVWAEGRFFQLDGQRRPTAVAGVPPDYFSAEGQLWGNPLYRWEEMEKDGYGWWIRRIGAAVRLYDVIRLDHFRGFSRYWSVPAAADSAREGHWESGPGMKLIATLRDWFSSVPFIAEDLGCEDEGVQRLLGESGFPGMRVLEFAFHQGDHSTYLPHRHIPHSVCYTGTHDNAPLREWYEELEDEDRDFARAYLGLNGEEGPLWGLIRGGMGSVATLFMAQMQDYLWLGAESRMNTPGTAQGNWRWRLLPGELTPALAEKLRAVTARYGRI